eukprot:365557-Pyramimonas_sp.AAC.1
MLPAPSGRADAVEVVLVAEVEGGNLQLPLLNLRGVDLGAEVFLVVVVARRVALQERAKVLPPASLGVVEVRVARGRLHDLVGRLVALRPALVLGPLLGWDCVGLQKRDLERGDPARVGCVDLLLLEGGVRAEDAAPAL